MSIHSRPQDSVHERLYRSNIGNISEFIIQEVDMKTMQEEKELKFIPKTNKSRLHSKRRSMQDFLNDMKVFSDKQVKKVQNIAHKQKEIEDKEINKFFKSTRSRSPNYDKIDKLYKHGVEKQRLRSKSPSVAEPK